MRERYNLYNVYKDGELVLEDAHCTEVARFTGCDRRAISEYVKHGMKISGTYAVEVSVPGQKSCYESDAERAFADKYGREALRQWIAMNQRYGAEGKSTRGE